MSNNNFVAVRGFIGFEPKIYKTKNGKMASFYLGIPDGKGKDDKPIYVNIGVKTFDTETAEAIEMLGKGALVMVTGRLVNEKYEKDGKTISNTVIVANYIGTKA